MNWKTCSGKCRSFTHRIAIFKPPMLRYVSHQDLLRCPIQNRPISGWTTRKQSRYAPQNLYHHSHRDMRKYRLSHSGPDHIARHYCTTLGPADSNTVAYPKPICATRTNTAISRTIRGYIEFLTLFAETTELVTPQGAAWHTASDAGTRIGPHHRHYARRALNSGFTASGGMSGLPTGTKATSARMQELKNIRSELVQKPAALPYRHLDNISVVLSIPDTPFRTFSAFCQKPSPYRNHRR